MTVARLPIEPQPFSPDCSSGRNLREMTCQHCQTWILDDDHRCRRCGRRVRNTPARISPNTYPIAATATAPAYDYEAEAPATVAHPVPPAPEPIAPAGQQALFSTPLSDPRVIPFESLTTQSERQSIRERAADLPRPTPLKTEKVEVRHARPRKPRSSDQRRLEFLGQEEVLAPPQSSIICDAPVAPVALRLEAGLIDTALIAIGCAFVAGAFLLAGGEFSFDKHVLLFLAMAFVTVPFAYKLLWTFAARDTIGTRCAGLRLVDFDGNPPSHLRRYHRLFGAILSLLAAAVGLIWCLVDEDCLTWHDHISGTFLTLAADPEE